MQFEQIAWSLLLLGVIGVLASLYLFPLLAIPLYVYQKRRCREICTSSSCPIDQRIRHFTVLIPVFNEAEKLQKTLESISQAKAQLSERVKLNVIVGIDGCSDRSADVAGSFAVETLSTPVNSGKWNMLKMLVSHAAPKSEWIILVDAGAIWPERFLPELCTVCSDSQVVACAPAYAGRKGEFFEQLHWQLERSIKRIEGVAGGPVSVHGATVAYRSSALLSTFQWLNGQQWKNDDVVIPLALRALFPEARVQYLPNIRIREASTYLSIQESQANREGVRRQRIAHGNTEWIRHLLLPIAQRNPVAFILSLRRVARLFWMYWLIAVGLGVSILIFQEASLFVFLLGLMFVIFSGAFLVMLYLLHLRDFLPRMFRQPHGFMRMASAGWASLMSPIFLLTYPRTKGQVQWR